MEELQVLLKSIRTELKLSLREAAKLIGISHSYLSALEKGVDPRTNSPIKPTPETLKLISSAYNISYNNLMKLSGYIKDYSDNVFAGPGKLIDIRLSTKDEKDVEKLLNNTMDYLEKQEGLMLSGEPMDENDLELLKQAIKNGLEYAKISNKKKYTPQKYRKE